MYKLIKKIFDFIFAIFLLIFLFPFLLIVAILIKINLGSPVIFIQDRIGINGNSFKIYKFRTMTNKKDQNGDFLPDEKRLTKFGLVLRNLSIDELPEIFNVLKGDMSFIGPRPLPVKYLDRYNDYQKRRHNVKPGITGLAQVNGRNSLSWKQRFEYDIYYVDNISFLLDLKIFIKTLFVVIERKGIHSNTSMTMEEFLGN